MQILLHCSFLLIPWLTDRMFVSLFGDTVSRGQSSIAGDVFNKLQMCLLITVCGHAYSSDAHVYYIKDMYSWRSVNMELLSLSLY